jgi:hypothetical protein
VNRERIVTGWNRAARKYLAKLPVRTVRVPKITLEEAAEMAATQRRIQQRGANKLTVTSNLVGMEFGILLSWQRSAPPSTGLPPEWLVLCGCGDYCTVSASALLRGRTTHCGCRARERRRVKAYRLQQALERAGRKRRPWKKFRAAMGWVV